MTNPENRDEGRATWPSLRAAQPLVPVSDGAEGSTVMDLPQTAVCPACEGTGEVLYMGGGEQIRLECPRCDGRGTR